MALFSTLSDDFNDGVIGAQWEGSYGTLRETGGRAGILCDTGYPALKTPANYTLTGSAVFCEAYPAATGGATSEVSSEMNIDNGSGTRLIIVADTFGGTIKFRNDVGYGDANGVTLTYSPTTHRWWRIREASGTVYMDTSPDAVTWTNHYSFPTPAWITDATLDPLMFSTHRSNGELTHYFEIDNVNVAPSGPPPTPTGLSVTAQDTTADVAWDATSGATGYDVEYRLAGVPDQTVEPWSTVTLTGSGTGTWTQTSGATVTLSGTGETVTFPAPPRMTQHDLTFTYGTTEHIVRVKRSRAGIRQADGTVKPMRLRLVAPAPAPTLLPATLRSTSSATVVSTTANKSIALPAGVVEGDLLIFVLATYGTSANTSVLPSGFTRIATHDRNTSHNVKIGWKLATSTEPTTYTPTIPSGNSHRADILAYYDADSTQLGTPVIGTTPASSTVHDAPSITPTTDHGVLLCLVSGGGGNLWTPPTNMTERTDAQTGASHYLTLSTADQQLTTADATGVRTFGGGGGNYSQTTASLFIPSTQGTSDGGGTATMLAKAGTNGSGGSKTNQEGIAFTAVQGAKVSSNYHRYAGHLTGDGPYPLVIHLHGDGAYEYENPNTWTSPQYMQVAKDINGIGIIPLTPDKTSGYQRWWEGYEPTYWLVDLIAELKRTFNVDTNRMFISGFSGGAVVTTANLVADWPEIFGGGGTMLLGGGGPYGTATTPTATLQSQFYMRWHVGDSDDGLLDDGVTQDDDGYDALTDTKNGEEKYRLAGWNTSRTLITGSIDHAESESYGPGKLQALVDEFKTSFGF